VQNVYADISLKLVIIIIIIILLFNWYSA